MNGNTLLTDYNALIIGASGAIGSAFFDAFKKDVFCLHVETISRSDSRFGKDRFDLLMPDSIVKHAAISKAAGPYQIIVDATGALHIDGVGPEKSLAALEYDQLVRTFQTNTIGPALVLREFAPLLASGRCIYAKLSARVGSIADNRKGGWYGYRSSKAAMNMILQTAALELQRKNPEAMIVALQPGTVRSRLSNPFSANVENLLEPEESASRMLTALKMLTPKIGAHFIDYQGRDIPW